MGGELRYVIKLVFYVSFGISSGTIAENISENVHNSKEQIKTISKRYDLDLQTCVDNFDIHADKIIRTQDSRAMGAKYINEIELSSREECLRFCCETNTCDVFVFEEKNPGSCYLFHCGSPDDFKCKFTKHHNYTSAVLTINRHMTELENQIKLTKHEHELIRLRKPETAAEQSTVPPLSATTVVPARPPPKETIQLIPAASNASTSRRCSRYQFECHSSGECIAIYNACDGIPQCADGSDEALELDCPDLGRTLLDSVTGTTQAPPALPTLSAVNDNKELGGNGPVPVISPYNNLHQQQQHINVNQQIPSQVMNSAADTQQLPAYSDAGTGSLYRQQQGWPQAQQPPSSLQQPQQYGGTQSNNNGVNLSSNQKLFPVSPNNQQQQIQGNKQYGREGEGAGYSGGSNPQWQNYQQQQMPPAATYQGPINQFQGGNNHGYEDQSSHIFNHKGNGLVADSDSPATQYGDAPHNEYKYSNNGPNNYYNNEPYRPPPANWQPHQLPAQDLNSMPAIDDIPPHLNDHDKNVKMGPDRIRGRYNTGPIPPDYYYEDSQEGKLHSLHAHGSDNPHQPQHNHRVQGEQESAADGATPVKAKDQQSDHKFQSSLEAKLEEDLSNIPRRKGSIDVHVVESQTKSSTEAPTVKTEATKVLHEDTSHLKKTHKFTVNMEEINLNDTTTEEEEEPGRPSGAILSLALGLCITGITVVLVACRLRVVRRRLRRVGKSPYAHDADYLVNGMYL